MKEEIIKTVIDGEKSIKNSDNTINKLIVRKRNLEEAIETFESEDIPVPESAYGLLDWIKSEINRETKIQKALINAIENLKFQYNLTLEDKANYISSHGGHYTWVNNGHLVDDDGIVFED